MLWGLLLVFHIRWIDQLVIHPKWTCHEKCENIYSIRKLQHKYRSVPQIRPPSRIKCLLQTWTALINDGHASYFAEAPCFLAPRWSSQPTASVGRISSPRVRRRLALGLHPPLTNNNEVMFYWKEGRNRERNCCIPRISPPAFFTEAKVTKGGAYLRDTMVME